MMPRALLLPLLAAAAVAEAKPPPNILVLMADNWAYEHTRHAGDKVVRTPTFDSLAAAGMSFNHAFCLNPSCAPARAAFLTGRATHQLAEAASLHGLFPQRFTAFPDLLEAAGYTIGYDGKGWAPGNWKDSGRSRNPAGTLVKDGFPAFLSQAGKDKPFFYWHSSHHPHVPWEEGAERKQHMDRSQVRLPRYLPDHPTVRENICDYLAEVELFDAECAELLAALEQDGRRADTLILITGDNGWQMPHGLGHVYDAGTRVPLAIVWPGQIAAASRSTAFVGFDDLAPTLLAAAGVSTDLAFTGHSLLPLLLGKPDPTARQAIYLERERHASVRTQHLGYPVRAVRTADYLYIRNYEPDRWPTGDPVMRHSVGEFGDTDFSFTKQLILDQRDQPAMQPFFSLLFGKRPAEELYDLHTDPDQTENLATAPQHQAARSQLAQQLADWMKQTADPRAENPQDPRWDHYTYYGKAGPGRKPKAAQKP